MGKPLSAAHKAAISAALRRRHRSNHATVTQMTPRMATSNRPESLRGVNAADFRKAFLKKRRTGK